MAQVLAPYPVRSVLSVHADLPDELAERFSLRSSLQPNEPVTPAAIKDAEMAVRKLESFQGVYGSRFTQTRSDAVYIDNEPAITEAVVQTAKDRAHCLKHIGTPHLIANYFRAQSLETASQSRFPNPTDLVQITALLRELRDGQHKIERDVRDGQRKMERDVEDIKRDIADVKREVKENGAGLRLMTIKLDNLRITEINEGKQKSGPPVHYMFRKKEVICPVHLCPYPC